MQKIVCLFVLMAVSAGAVFSQTEKSEKTIVKDDKLFYVHEVTKGQTLYRLSKIYQVSIEEITNYNPTVKQGLKAENIIYIPVKENVAIENKGDSILNLHQGIKKNIYTVYLLMPFYLSDAVFIETLKIKSLHDYAAIKPFAFIQFYEAMLLAAEDISARYPQVKIYLQVEDITTATQITELIKSGKLDNADMIIGPFQGKEFSTLCQYAQNKNILLVNPFSTTFDTHNSLTYKATTINTYQAESFANYVLEKYPNANIIFANNQSQDEIKQITDYISGMRKVFENEGKNINIQEVNIKSGGISAIKSAMNAAGENFLFTFFEGELMVTNFVQNLQAVKFANLALVAPEKWLDYDNIETEYFMKLNTHYISQYFVEYSNPKVIRFIDAFRNAYDTEPALALYAFQGYDFTYYFLSKLCETGTGLQAWDNNEHLLSTKFKFIQSLVNKNMLENTFSHVFKLKNYRFIDAYSDNEFSSQQNTSKQRR